MSCTTPGRGATKEVIEFNHKLKMEKKRQMRDYYYENAPKQHVFANLSKNHPNYGDTPAQDQARKNNS